LQHHEAINFNYGGKVLWNINKRLELLFGTMAWEEAATI
jgi:hypothetical protein